MAIPDYQTFMLPLMCALASGRRSVRECIPDLVAHFDLTREEAAELLPSGKKTILADRAHWARTYLSKAGLLRSPRRNVHELTEAGRRLLASRPDRITNEMLATFPGFEEWRNASRGGGTIADGSIETVDEMSATPNDRIDEAVSEIDNALSVELIAILRAVDPQRFEQIVVDLLLAMGYGGGSLERGRRIGRSGDGGIDGVIDEDQLGLDRIYVQAKRYKDGNTVPAEDVRGFVGAMDGERATKGVFVTTSGFSERGLEFARKVSKRVVLIDGTDLAKLMIRHSVGVRIERQIAVREIDQNYFSEE